MEVLIGSVETFPDARPDKAQVLKVLEECAEVFAAWQNWIDAQRDDYPVRWRRNELIDECSDLIQATSNLLAGLGVEDMTEAMEQCRLRNVERGRM